MIDQMENALAMLRHTKRRLTTHLAIEVLVFVVMLVVTAIIIDIERPWWVIALSFITTTFWQVVATRTLLKLVTIRRDEVKLAGIVGTMDETMNALRAFGLPDDLLRKFGGATPTDVVTDEDPAPATEETKA